MEELKQAKADALGQVAALEGEVARFQVIRFFLCEGVLFMSHPGQMRHNLASERLAQTVETLEGKLQASHDEQMRLRALLAETLKDQKDLKCELRCVQGGRSFQ